MARKRERGRITSIRVLTVTSSILSVPTGLPFRSLGWFKSTSSEPCSSMSTISSFEICTSPGGSLRLDGGWVVM